MFIFFFCLNNVQYVIYGNVQINNELKLNWISEGENDDHQEPEESSSESENENDQVNIMH